MTTANAKPARERRRRSARRTAPASAGLVRRKLLRRGEESRSRIAKSLLSREPTWREGETTVDETNDVHRCAVGSGTKSARNSSREVQNIGERGRSRKSRAARRSGERALPGTCPRSRTSRCARCALRRRMLGASPRDRDWHRYPAAARHGRRSRSHEADRRSFPSPKETTPASDEGGARRCTDRGPRRERTAPETVTDSFPRGRAYFRGQAKRRVPDERAPTLSACGLSRTSGASKRPERPDRRRGTPSATRPRDGGRRDDGRRE